MKKSIFIGLLGLVIGFGSGFAVGIYTLPILIANKNAQQIKNKYSEQNSATTTKKTVINTEKNIKSDTKQVIVNTEKKQNNIINKIQKVKNNYSYSASFNKDAKDSDFFHWGSGNITIKNNVITFHDNVELAPGPDYRLYAITKYVETEDEFWKIKNNSVEIANITMFDGFQQFNIPKNIDISKYEAILIWCEAFKEFITVAKLQKNK